MRKSILSILLLFLVLVLGIYIGVRLTTLKKSDGQIEETALVEKPSPDMMCGPIALTRVCTELGVEATVEEIAKLAGTDETGTSMYGLFHAAQSKGLRAVGMLLNLQELKEIAKPIIVHFKSGHFVAVEKIENDQVTITDQKGLNRTLHLKQFKRKWDGYVLIVGK